MVSSVEIEKPRERWYSGEELVRTAGEEEDRWFLDRTRFYVPKPDTDMLAQMQIEAASEKRPTTRSRRPKPLHAHLK